MNDDLDRRARKMLKTTGLYCTKARVAILKVLLDMPRPVRQDEIAENSTDRTLNKVTIYRTLESLVEAGLVHRAFMQERAWHFELAHHCTDKQCHPHFTCSECGVTRCLPGVFVPMAKSPFKGFIFNRQQVRLEGICPDCSQDRDRPEGESESATNHCHSHSH